MFCKNKHSTPSRLIFMLDTTASGFTGGYSPFALSGQSKPEILKLKTYVPINQNCPDGTENE
jgi:hypothetical protein